MLNITDVVHQPLTWTQPRSLKMEFELRTDEALVATLKLRSSWTGTVATGRSAEECWTFKHIGFMQNKALIRTCDTAVDVAVFQQSNWTSAGTLTFSQGQCFKVTGNFWGSKYEWQTNIGDPLVRFKYGSVFRLSAQVEILPAARSLAELPLLVLFGWYIVTVDTMYSGFA